MPRTRISEFSATAADNTDIDNIDIAEGCAPSGINNAIRELMAQLKDMQTGASGDPFTLTTVNSTTVDTTNLEVSNLKAKDGTAAGSIADSTGVVTLTSVTGTTADYTNLEVTNLKAKDGTAAGSIADSTGVVTINTLSTGGGVISPQTGFKNRIINGGMTIDQRNAGASVTATDGGYQIDRYQTFTESADGVFTVQRVADAPSGFINSAKITVTTADASIGASQRYLFLQNIEGFNISDLGFGTASASAVTVSFWVKSSLTGNFGACLSNTPFQRTYPFNYTISVANTWEYKTVTVPGDTTGTWATDNSVGLRLMFGIGAGSNNVGPANAWAATAYFQPTGSINLISTLSATINITGVQLEKGSTATPFEFRSIGDEEILCYRYFQTYSNPPLRGVYASTSAASRCGMVLPVVMRATPTATVGTLDFFDGNSVSTASSISVAYLNAKSVEFDFTVASAVMGAFRPAVVYQSGSTNNLFLTAEL